MLISLAPNLMQGTMYRREILCGVIHHGGWNKSAMSFRQSSEETTAAAGPSPEM
ncbi:MAG TPA: hypothetical protein VLL97_08400 [Acidobacteriota bacterium]|nr:hypothetical protein [Acidobacteriota bacterium]